MTSAGVTIGNSLKTNIRLENAQITVSMCLDTMINLGNNSYAYVFSLVAPDSIGCGGHDVLGTLGTGGSASVTWSLYGVSSDGTVELLNDNGNIVSPNIASAGGLSISPAFDIGGCIKNIIISMSFGTSVTMTTTYCNLILCIEKPLSMCESLCEQFFVKSGAKMFGPSPL